MDAAGNQDDSRPLILTVGATAGTLSVSKRTVRRLLDAGELRLVRIGRAVRVNADSARDLVNRAETATGVPPALADSAYRANLAAGTVARETDPCHE